MRRRMRRAKQKGQARHASRAGERMRQLRGTWKGRPCAVMRGGQQRLPSVAIAAEHRQGGRWVARAKGGERCKRRTQRQPRLLLRLRLLLLLPAAARRAPMPDAVPGVVLVGVALVAGRLLVARRPQPGGAVRRAPFE